MIINRFPEQKRAELQLAVLFTGADVYAARVEFYNRGNVPIRVYPQNIQMHFGSETARVYTADEPGFLRQTTLPPGQTLSGLVTYGARMDIGSAMRLGQGALSYTDPSITVTYE